MPLNRRLPGIGEVTVESVGGTGAATAIHLTVRGDDGRHSRMAFALLLDEELNPRLSHIGGLRVPSPSGILQPYVDLAGEYLETDRSGLFFLMLGRVEMDLDTLRREKASLEQRSRPYDHLTPRIKQLARAYEKLLEWSGNPDGPLPIQFGPSAPAPFGFELRPFTAGEVTLALASGEVASFRNDAIHSPLTLAIQLAAEAGHRMVPYSFRDDPFGDSRAVYEWIARTGHRGINSPLSLGWQFETGKLSSDDLIVLEATNPLASRAISFLERLTATGMDSVTIVFDASVVHVGKASELLSAFRRQPTIEDLLDEVESRLGLEESFRLDRYVSIIEKVAGRYGMDPDEAFEAFRTQRGDRYAVTLDGAPPVP